MSPRNIPKIPAETYTYKAETAKPSSWLFSWPSGSSKDAASPEAYAYWSGHGELQRLVSQGSEGPMLLSQSRSPTMDHT